MLLVLMDFITKVLKVTIPIERSLIPSVVLHFTLCLIIPLSLHLKNYVWFKWYIFFLQAEKLNTILNAAKCEVEPFWPSKYIYMYMYISTYICMYI